MKEKSYRWDSQDYAKHSSAQLEWAQELIAKLRLRGDEAVLDIGSGDGKVTAAIAAQVPQGSVVGIDSSADMIALARRTFPAPEHPNLSFQEMDARRITFTSRFDVVFSSATLHWVKDQRAVLLGVSGCLKDGGRILFQLGGRGNAADILSVFDVLTAGDRWKPYFRDFEFPYGFYGPEEYRPWLEEAGFRALRVELIPKDMKQEGREGLAGWIRTTWLPYTQRLPAELREPFIAEIVDRYAAARPADAGGMMHVPMVRLEVEAVKAGPSAAR